jgi:hypothetical protein
VILNYVINNDRFINKIYLTYDTYSVTVEIYII